jgi:hypothetical protein
MSDRWLVFARRLDMVSGGDTTHYALSKGRVNAATKDGHVVELSLSVELSLNRVKKSRHYVS